MAIRTGNDQINQGVEKYFVLNHLHPAVSFDLIYPYTVLYLTNIVLTANNTNKGNKGGILADYYLRITLKKTNGESRSFPVNLIKYIHTMRVVDHTEDISFTLNLHVAQENVSFKKINAQEPFYYYAEVALENNLSSTNKPVELKIYYQDSDGLELNKR